MKMWTNFRLVDIQPLSVIRQERDMLKNDRTTESLFECDDTEQTSTKNRNGANIAAEHTTALC